jgi:hypothetical protein
MKTSEYVRMLKAQRDVALLEVAKLRAQLAAARPIHIVEVKAA